MRYREISALDSVLVRCIDQGGRSEEGYGKAESARLITNNRATTHHDRKLYIETLYLPHYEIAP